MCSVRACLPACLPARNDTQARRASGVAAAAHSSHSTGHLRLHAVRLGVSAKPFAATSKPDSGNRAAGRPAACDAPRRHRTRNVKLPRLLGSMHFLGSCIFLPLDNHYSYPNPYPHHLGRVWVKIITHLVLGMGQVIIQLYGY
jgi:hypothetical protein